MEHTSIEVLHQEWQCLAAEYKAVMCKARLQGLTGEQLDALDRKYTHLVDAAYSRLKYAEAREAWRSRLSSDLCQMVGSQL